MTGILWTVSFCARDGLAYLDRIEANMSELFLNTSSRNGNLVAREGMRSIDC